MPLTMRPTGLSSGIGKDRKDFTVYCGEWAMLSFAEERDRIFERWLSEVERLLARHVDRDAAFAAWTNGYSAREICQRGDRCRSTLIRYCPAPYLF